MADDKTAEEGEKPKSKTLLIVIIAVVVALAVGGGAVFFLLGGKEEAPAEVVEVDPSTLPAAYFDLKPPFVAHFTDKGRKRYAQISLAVMARDEAVIGVVQDHMPLIRNNIMMVLNGAEFEMLKTPAGKEELQQTLLEEVQHVLTEQMGEPGVEQVFFTNFVMQ